jgi:hypothetical protein
MRLVPSPLRKTKAVPPIVRLNHLRFDLCDEENASKVLEYAAEEHSYTNGLVTACLYFTAEKSASKF